MFGRKPKEVEILQINEKTIIHEDNVYIRHDERQEKELIRIIAIQTETIEMLLKDEHKHHKKVHLAFTQNINNTKSIIMALSLNQGQFALGVLALIDSDTNNAVSATFANPVFTGSNDAAFTVAPDSSDPNTARVTAVAAGTGTVSASVDATYTDSVSGSPVTKSLTVSVDVSVVAVSAGENVALQLNFGAPQTA